MSLVSVFACLAFSIVKGIHYIEWGYDRSTSESESEYSEHSPDTDSWFTSV